MEKVVIIGHGPAGLTAAIYSARAGLEPLVLHSSSELGQLDQTTDVENFPGFPEGVLGPDMIVNMHKQAERFGAKFKLTHVQGVTGDGPFTLSTDSGDIEAESVILATGAKPRRLGLDSESKYWGNGVTACAVCDGFFYRGQEVLVIGGGDSACEEATFLTKFASKVKLIHRRDTLRAEKLLQKKLMENDKIEIIWDSAVEEVIGDSEPKNVKAIKIKNLKTNQIDEIKIDGLFIAIGHDPATALFKDQLDMDKEGYLLTKPDSTETNIPGVYAAGDVKDKTFRQAVTAAGMGCMAALEAEKFLSH